RRPHALPRGRCLLRAGSHGLRRLAPLRGVARFLWLLSEPALYRYFQWKTIESNYWRILRHMALKEAALVSDRKQEPVIIARLALNISQPSMSSSSSALACGDPRGLRHQLDLSGHVSARWR